jgi:hypothetical protein
MDAAELLEYQLNLLFWNSLSYFLLPNVNQIIAITTTEPLYKKNDFILNPLAE